MAAMLLQRVPSVPSLAIQVRQFARMYGAAPARVQVGPQVGDEVVAAAVFLGLRVEDDAGLGSRVRLVGEAVDASEFVEDALAEMAELLQLIGEMDHVDMPGRLRDLARLCEATADQLDEWAGRPRGEDDAPF